MRIIRLQITSVIGLRKAGGFHLHGVPRDRGERQLGTNSESNHVSVNSLFTIDDQRCLCNEITFYI